MPSSFLVAGGLVVGLPFYLYLLTRMVGAGWFTEKLAHHRKVLNEHE